jgi:hypothetical protein
VLSRPRSPSNRERDPVDSSARAPSRCHLARDYQPESKGSELHARFLALHYRSVPSEENNKVFGQAQSFVPGAPTNIQFMVKDSKKYAATGGWGFGHFADGKPGDAAFMKTCFPCHEKAKATDLVFTRYAP